MVATMRAENEELPENDDTSVDPVYLANLILTLSMEALSQEITIQGAFN